MKHSKMTISIFLSIVLIVTMIPASSLAESGVGTSVGTNENAEDIISDDDLVPDRLKGYELEEVDEASNTYVNPDTGDMTTTFFTEDVRYMDPETEELTDLDPSLIESEIEGYAFENAEGDAKQYFPETLSSDNHILLSKDKYKVSFAPKFTDGLGADFAAPEVKNVEYTDPYENTEKRPLELTYSKDTTVSLSLRSGVRGIKEDVIFKEKPEIERLDFSLNTNELIPVVTEDKSRVIFVDTKELEEKKEIELCKVIGEIPEALIYDSADEPAYARGDYELTGISEGEYLLSILLPMEYFNDNNPVYPVVADPSYEWENNYGILARTVHSNPDVTNQSGSETALAVGTSSGREYITYLSFRRLKNFLDILESNNRTVNKATLTIYRDNGRTNTGSPKISVYEAKEPTDNQASIGPHITWKNKPGYVSSALAEKTFTLSSSSVLFNLTSHLNAVIKRNSRNHYGVVLISKTPNAYASIENAKNGGIELEVEYSGGNIPKIEDMANYPDQIDYVEIDTPCVNAIADNTVRVTATPEEMDDIDTYEYRIAARSSINTSSGSHINMSGNYREYSQASVSTNKERGTVSFNVNIQGIPEGCYRIFVRGVNKFGNGQGKGAALHIDNTKPAIGSLKVSSDNIGSVKMDGDTSVRFKSKSGKRAGAVWSAVTDKNSSGESCNAKEVAMQMRISRGGTVQRDWHYPSGSLASSLTMDRAGELALADSYFESFGPGTYTVSFRPVDAAGNAGEEKSISYLIPYPRLGLEIYNTSEANVTEDTLIARKVDTAADGFFEPTDAVTPNEPLRGTVSISALIPERFHATASTTLKAESISLDNGDSYSKEIAKNLTTDATFPLYTPLLPDGTYKLTLSGTDGKGNIAPPQSIECKIDNPLPAPELIVKKEITSTGEFDIEWKLFGMTAELKDIQYSLDDGESWTNVNAKSPTSGSFHVTTKRNADGTAKQGTHKLLVRGIKYSEKPGDEREVGLIVYSEKPNVKIHSFEAGTLYATAKARYFDSYKVYIKRSDELDLFYREVLLGTNPLSAESAGFIDMSGSSYSEGLYTIKLEALSASGVSETDKLVIYRPDTSANPEEGSIILSLPNRGTVDDKNYTVGSSVAAAESAHENDPRTFYISGEKTDSIKTGQARDFHDNFENSMRYPEGEKVSVIATIDKGSAHLSSGNTYASALEPVLVSDIDKGKLEAKDGKVDLGWFSTENGKASASLTSEARNLALPVSSVTLRPLEKYPPLGIDIGSIEYLIKVDDLEYCALDPNIKLSISEITGGRKVYASKLSVKAVIKRGTVGVPSLSKIDIDADIISPDYLSIDFLSKYAPKSLTASDKINYKTYIDWINDAGSELPENIFYEVYQAKSLDTPEGLWTRLGDEEKGTYFVNPRIGDFSHTFFYKVRAVRKVIKGGGLALAKGEYSNVATSNVIDRNEFVKRLGVKDFYSYETIDTPAGTAQIEKSWGNLAFTQTDKAVETDRMMSEGLTRTYNSQSSSVSYFGLGQDFSFGIEVLKLGREAEQRRDGKISSYALKDETGTIELFLPSDDIGNYHSFHSLHTKLEVFEDNPKEMVITKNEGKEDDSGKSLSKDVVKRTVYYRLTNKDMTEYWFNVSGKLLVIKDTNGNYLTVDYDDEKGFISKLTSNSNRQISFTTNDQGFIVLATLPDGRGVHYSYNSDKTLKQVRVFKEKNVKLDSDFKLKDEYISGEDIVYRYDYENDSMGRPHMSVIYDQEKNPYKFSYKPSAIDNLFVQLTEAENPANEKVTFTYGSLLDSETITERFAPGSTSANYRETAAFDDRGQITRMASSTPGQLLEEELVTTFKYQDNLLMSQSSVREWQELSGSKVIRNKELVTEEKNTYIKGTENVATSSDDSGAVTENAYNAAGAVNENEPSDVKTTTAEGEVIEDMSSTYDEETGNPLEEIDRVSDEIVRNEYDERGNLTKESTYIQEYVNGIKSGTEAIASLSVYKYDEFDNQIEMVTTEYGSPNVTTKSENKYDVMGRLTYEAEGNVVNGAFVNVTSTQSTYDFMGRLTKSVTTEPGKITKTNSTEYNKTGTVKSSVDEKGIKASNVYDKLGRNISTTTSAPGEQSRTTKTSYGYETISVLTLTGEKQIKDAASVKSTNPAGEVSCTYSDAFGNPASSEAAGVRSDTILASDGKTIATAIYPKDDSSKAKISASLYDSIGNQTHSLSNASIAGGYITATSDTAVSVTEYDTNGKVISETDALGASSSFSYDAKGELASVTLPPAVAVNPGDSKTSLLKPVTKFSKDISDDGSVIDSTTDALGRLSRATSDPNGKLLKISDYGQSTASSSNAIETSFTYDNKGNEIKRTYGNGDYVSSTYDARGNLTRIDRYRKGGTLESHTLNEYDSDGRLTVTTDYDEKGKVIYSQFISYDIFGKATSVHEERAKEATASSKAVKYEYDILDRVVKEDYSEISGSLAGEPTSLENVYNDKGQLTEIYAQINAKRCILASYEYDDFGKLISSKNFYAFAKGDKEKYTLKTYTYDKKDNLISMTYSDSKTPAAARESFSYTYDKNGSILSERHVNSYAPSKTDETRKYTYDALGRMSSSVITNNITGSKKTSSYGFDAVSNMRHETVNGVVTYHYYNGLNQLIKKEGGSPASTSNYTYDAKGNQISEKVGNNAITTSTYDVENRLTSVSKQGKVINRNTYNSAGQRLRKIDSGSKETNYYYQNGAVLYTTSGSGNKTAFNLMGASGNVISTLRYDGKYAGKYYTYNKDIRTSATNITDDAGNYVTSYDYTEYGETTKAGDTAFYNEINYTGGIFDESTGLYYLNARYYSPMNSRFLSQDTYRGDKNDPSSLNLYAYCANNPINFVDPSGHIPIENTKIYIDPGHGGKDDLGAVRKYKKQKYYEKDLNLSLAKKVNKKLKSAGANTKISRTSDIAVSLKNRYESANTWKASIFVSIHHNASYNPLKKGTTVLYAGKHNTSSSKRLAGLINKNVASAVGFKNRGIEERTDLAVLNGTNMTAILTETGYMSNSGDKKRIINKQNKTANAIVKGIKQNFDIKFTAPK